MYLRRSVIRGRRCKGGHEIANRRLSRIGRTSEEHCPAGFLLGLNTCNLKTAETNKSTATTMKFGGRDSLPSPLFLPLLSQLQRI
jgi:hypothetical protein